MRASVTVCSLLAVGCSGPGPSNPPGDDASTSSDAIVGPFSDASSDSANVQFGMAIDWTANPTIPATIEQDQLASVILTTARVQLIGDATSGDDRTTQTNVVMMWQQNLTPSVSYFSEAPAGRYSTITLRLDVFGTATHAYELTGAAERMGATKPFIIRDDQRLDVSIPFDKVLDPGMYLALEVELDLRDAINNVPWDDIPLDGDGVIVLEPGMTELAKFRTDLQSAFRVK